MSAQRSRSPSISEVRSRTGASERRSFAAASARFTSASSAAVMSLPFESTATTESSSRRRPFRKLTIGLLRGDAHAINRYSARGLTISDHERGEDFGTKADRGLTATRVPQLAAWLRGWKLGAGAGANHYWCTRLVNNEGRVEASGGGGPAPVLGGVRGARAGRPPGGNHSAQNFTESPAGRSSRAWGRSIAHNEESASHGSPA